MRARTNINTKAQRHITLDNFRGVDFSSSPLRVGTSRATDMQNLICDFGVNRKRNGWCELMRFYNDDTETGYRINGIFDFEANNCYIVHAGKHLYKFDKNSKSVNLLSDKAADQASSAFIHFNELYILCGEFMVYREVEGAYVLQTVDESVAYVPTTTISINKLNEEGVPDGTQEAFELTNGLTARRKNKLVGTVASSEEPAAYKLDGRANRTKPIIITVDYGGANETVEIPGSENTEYIPEFSTQSGALSGKFYYDDGGFSKIVFFTDTSSKEGDGEHNITVEFSSDSFGENKLDLSRCTFGMKFGADGNTDRLFLGGHPDYPNEDFYSEWNNFLYFPPGNRTTFGTDNSPIMAYARLSDTTQVIYKAENPMEATIYYRTGKTNVIYDDDGNFVKRETVFPITAGAIGEGVISGRACANLTGDVLMLSSNGVFGLSVGENIATSERYAKVRSRSINAKLCSNNLKSAVGIVYKNRYYLAVDGVCYIADSRYKYVAEDTADGSYNYEWWYWTNIPAVCFAEIDGELYFGTEDGRVCKFDNEYTDRDNHIATDGDFTIKVDDNICYYNPVGKLHGICDNDTITVSEACDAVHVAFLEECEIENSKICNVGEKSITLYEGMCLYADRVGESGLETGRPYYVGNIDRGTGKFNLYTAKHDSGEAVNIKAGGFRLSKRINGVPWLIGNVGFESFNLVSLKNGEHETDVLIAYNGRVPVVEKASFTHHKNVVAKWVSAVTDLGSNVFSKTLLKLTIAVEPNGAGPISFGYETRLTNTALTARGMREFSFDNTDFTNFTFETAFATSYTAKVKERNFNYIVFRFISDSEYPCAVHNLTATYKINKENRGIM